MVDWPPIRWFWTRFPLFLRAAAATLPLLAITLYLYVESRSFERQLLEAETTREADYVSLQLQTFIAERVGALRGIGNFELAAPAGSDHVGLSGFVNRLWRDVPNFEEIDWIESNGAARSLIPRSDAHSEVPDLGDGSFAALRAKAAASRAPVATGSFPLGASGQGLAVFVPVYRDGTLDGLVAGTVRLTDGLGQLYGRDVLDFWNLELKDRTERTAYLSPGTGGGKASSVYVAPPRFIPVADQAWKLRLWPTPLLTATLRTGAPPRILIIGLVATLIAAAANYLLAQRQARLRDSLQESERLTVDVEVTRQHLSDLVNGIEAVIWESDADIHHFTFVNDYARKLLSIDTHRWVSEPAFWLEHVHPDDRTRVRAHTRAARQPGQTYTAEYRMIDSSERALWVREIITVIGKGDRLIGRRGVVVDISARVQAEEAVRQSQKLESLGVLAGGIAHDFNNLLTTILGNAEMLSPFLRDSEAVGRGYLDKIERTTRRLAELTRQMLAYSGRGRLSVEKINLNSVIREMSELLSITTPKNVRMVFNLDLHLPPMEADAVQMRQVILNLLTNAAEAIGEQAAGEVVLSTAVDTLDGTARDLYPGQELSPGNYVRLDVRDNGCGMSEETLSKIFDPFFTTKFTGRGLGLAALQGIVRGHRGGIRIVSQAGEGTTFTLLFPASGELPPLFVCQDHPQGILHPGVERACVLLVDDEEGLRSLMAAALREAGTHVYEAADGQEALEEFRLHGHEIDVVVLDLTMPRIGGEEVFRRIRAAQPATCIILCSGYTEEDINRQFAGRGLSGFLEKPFTPSELIEKIRSVLVEDGHGGVRCGGAHLEMRPVEKVGADGARNHTADGT